MKGLFAFGMNGVAIGPDSQKNIDALKKADLLVVCEIYPDETSEFWQAPGITPEEMKRSTPRSTACPARALPKKTDMVELGPLAAVEERRGSAARRRAARPGHPGADLSEGARAVSEGRRQVPRSDPEPRAGPTRSRTIPSLAEIAKEINGQAIADITDPDDRADDQGRAAIARASPFCSDDGTHLCGNWLYCGSWTEAGALMQRRGTDDPPASAFTRTGPGRGRRTAASCTTARRAIWPASRGTPTASQVWWNEAARRWVGNDVPDFKADSKPASTWGRSS